MGSARVTINTINGSNCKTAIAYYPANSGTVATYVTLMNNTSATVRLASTPNSSSYDYSYEFTSWTYNISGDGDFSDSISVTVNNASSQNTTATISFNPALETLAFGSISFTATYAQRQNPLIKIKSLSSNGSIIVDGVDQYNFSNAQYTSLGKFTYGTQHSFQAIPIDGWQFVRWYVNGGQAAGGNPLTFTMRDTAQYDIAAQFTANTYRAIFQVSPVGSGSITGASTGNYSVGQQFSISPSAASNYTFSNWKIEHYNTDASAITRTEEVSTVNYTFSMPGHPITVTAVFVKNDGLGITIQGVGANGSVNVTPTTQSYSSSGNKEFRVTASAIANSGYHFSSWNSPTWTTSGTSTFNCSEIPDSSSGQFEFEIRVASNETSSATITISANFVADSSPTTYYTIRTSSNNSSAGSVSGGAQYESGSSATVTATNNAGYKFVNWTESGTQVSASTSYTFTVTSNRTLIANFEPIIYNITWNLDGGEFSRGYDYTAVSGDYTYIYNPTTMPFDNSAYTIVDGTKRNLYFQYGAPQKANYEFLGWKITGFNLSTAQVWYSTTHNFTDSEVSDALSGSTFDTSKLDVKRPAMRRLQTTDGATVTFTALWKRISIPAKIYSNGTWKNCKIKLRRNNSWVEIPIKLYKNGKWIGKE